MRHIAPVLVVFFSLLFPSCQLQTKIYTSYHKSYVWLKSFVPEEDIITSYKFRDSKGVNYPIVLHTYTRGENAGKTTSYIVKTSKTGKPYRYYLPNGMEIAEDILGQK